MPSGHNNCSSSHSFSVDLSRNIWQSSPEALFSNKWREKHVAVNGMNEQLIINAQFMNISGKREDRKDRGVNVKNQERIHTLLLVLDILLST